jgi:hypothetical protein
MLRRPQGSGTASLLARFYRLVALRRLLYAVYYH